jgi:hypothetical protein
MTHYRVISLPFISFAAFIYMWYKRASIMIRSVTSDNTWCYSVREPNWPIKWTSEQGM